MAFLGGMIAVDAIVYKKILGLLLLFSVLRLLVSNDAKTQSLKPYNLPMALGIGVVIGALSGLIGIGGGIILSPLLLLLNWTDQKQTAAISAIFIFVNSASGFTRTIDE